MMKPSWIDAPEWANYLVQYPHGVWAWHASEPILRQAIGGWEPTGRSENIGAPAWEKSLEARQ